MPNSQAVKLARKVDLGSETRCTDQELVRGPETAPKTRPLTLLCTRGWCAAHDDIIVDTWVSTPYLGTLAVGSRSGN